MARRDSMRASEKLKDYANVIEEFAMYLQENKSYWLAPVIFVLLLLSSLAFFLEGSVLAPAIYSIF
jgi:nitrate reductase assembly molybdenum cofactor insertion protein NarJ